MSWLPSRPESVQIPASEDVPDGVTSALNGAITAFPSNINVAAAFFVAEMAAATFDCPNNVAQKLMFTSFPFGISILTELTSVTFESVNSWKLA